MLSRVAPVLLLTLTMASVRVQAQLSPVAAAIGGEEAKGVIDKAGQAANSAIAQAAREGNGLIAHAASELNLLTNNAQLVLGSSESKFVRDLSVPQANLLGQISALSQQLNDAQNRAYYIRDVSFVDISNLTATLPFTNVPYFVQKVTGLSQVRGNADYKFQIVARGIEIASSESASAISVEIEGQPVDAQVSVSQRGAADITITSTTLDRFFKRADAATVVKAHFNITVVAHPKKRLFSNPGDVTTKISAPVWLSLYPQHAGDITVTAYAPVYKWVRLDPAHEVKTPSTPVFTIKDFDLGVATGGSLDTPGARRIVGARLVCDATYTNRMQFCGPGAYWSYQQPLTISPDGSHATATIKNTGEELWWTLHLDVDELRVDPTPLKEVKAYSLNWDTPVQIDLPPDWTNYRIDGTTVTKREIHLNENTSMEPFLKFESLGVAPPKPLRQLANYRVGLPE